MKCEICGGPAGHVINGAIGLCEECMGAAGEDLDACEVRELDYDEDDDESDEENA